MELGGAFDSGNNHELPASHIRTSGALGTGGGGVGGSNGTQRNLAPSATGNAWWF